MYAARQHRTQQSKTQSFLQQEIIRININYGPFVADVLSNKAKLGNFLYGSF